MSTEPLKRSPSKSALRAGGSVLRACLLLAVLATSAGCPPKSGGLPPDPPSGRPEALIRSGSAGTTKEARSRDARSTPSAASAAARAATSATKASAKAAAAERPTAVREASLKPS